MKAYVLQVEGLKLKEINKPLIKSNQVMIATKAISLNPVDYKVTQGTFDLKRPITIGIDVAGEIVEIGDNVSSVKLGDRVCAMVNIFETGSFADFVVVDSEILTILPSDVSYLDASTIPCAGITAYQAIHEKVNIRSGQTVFITAGGGGVGGFAIQFAKQRGATVITSASGDFDRIRELGADYIINYKEEDISTKIMEITQGKGVDYFINSISASDIEKYAAILRFNGSIVGITGIPEKYPFIPFTKAAGISEVALVATYNTNDKDSLREVAKAGEQIAEWISKGEISTNITTEIRFEQIPEALEWFERGKTKGKVVVNKEL
ncbi:zinc-binding dehydrogenase [Sediminitomix flava]|uniref:NADPH:quinone reductase-like Zn-dependent oxidoreductase n=1 Tax=Sediminitomix flava TaxID=379075 RepID=A0A315Z7P5_SEDFL|nr:zinc-binding dehydrogenase [Sediminitomix flava]PWJ40877.1 NADPH:quinone reductase-like Zn-dependent oxidoreductase [Sediminitomix flava]